MTKSLTSHNEWRYLLRDFLRSSQGRPLATYSKDALRFALAPVAALSLWIDEYAPALKEKTTLDIVIAGAAHGMDTLDEGRWYQFLPLFLGKPDMKLTLDLVGKGLDPDVPEVFSGDAFPLQPKKSAMAANVAQFATPQRFPSTLANTWFRAPVVRHRIWCLFFTPDLFSTATHGSLMVTCVRCFPWVRLSGWLPMAKRSI